MNQFELFLNRMRGGNIPGVDMPTPQEPQPPDFRVPSQMPGAMGGGFDHGITGDLSDIQNRPFDYGMKGGLKQMPYRGEEPILVPLPKGGSTPALDADGRPIPGTSTGIYQMGTPYPSSNVLFQILTPRRN